MPSFPAMGTWIEMSYHMGGWDVMLSRSLQWERGLKYPAVAICDDTMKSFPAMGTWIEIYKADKDAPEKESFPAMGTWIEI